jgi:anti-sigma factor RsiW
MDCGDFRGRLDRYVDGELSGEEVEETREHLEGCASCAKAAAGLRHLRGSLKRVVNRHRPPQELEAEVLRAVRSRKRVPVGRALDERRGDGTPVWRANVVVPAPFFALLILSLFALAGWLIFARAPVREDVSAKRPAPVASPAPPAEASGGFDFSRYYRGERASIQVVRRASLEGSRQ